MNINTENFENVSDIINDVYSFTCSSTTKPSFCNSKSIIYETKNDLENDKKIYKKYTLNLDWVQFIVKPLQIVNFDNFHNEVIKIEKVQFHQNPNYRNSYLVFVQENEVCTLFTEHIKENDEILVKVSNSLLYTNDCFKTISSILDRLSLQFHRVSRLDIALDGMDNLKVLSILKSYIRNKTILISNDNLKVNSYGFNKDELQFGTHEIGSKKYQKIARIYNKTNELINSEKKYITDFWIANNLYTDEGVGRFELQLGYRHLKKYNIDSLMKLNDSEFINSLFYAEVRNWLRFYKVKLKDLNNHRKDIAIKKGKEINYIKWNHIPLSTTKLETVENKVNPIFNIKRSITTTIKELTYSNDFQQESINDRLRYISTVTSEYNLQSHTNSKIQEHLRKIENPKENPLYIYFYPADKKFTRYIE